MIGVPGACSTWREARRASLPPFSVVPNPIRQSFIHVARLLEADARVLSHIARRHQMVTSKPIITYIRSVGNRTIH
jgi:hypothetical protein